MSTEETASGAVPNDLAAFMDAIQQDTTPITLALEERITSQLCMVCSQYIKHGQVVSGIRLAKDAEEVIGHYACIITMLGPERTLQAILAHRLPAINVATLVDGRVPGWKKQFDVDI